MSQTLAIPGFIDTGTGRQAPFTAGLVLPDGGTNRTIGQVGVLSETVLYSQFTDGGGSSGTYVMKGSLPAGAIVLASKIGAVTGFTGDAASAVLTIGDGSDVDRYNTGTPSVYTTAAVGVECGIPSGTKLLTAANSPTLTVTSAADFTSVSAGSVTVSIYYIQA